MLTNKAKQQLKAQAHKLKPVVLIGNQGVTSAVQKEVDRALLDHELIKVRIATEDRDLRKQLFNELCANQQAELVQVIGSIGVLFRKKPDGLT